MRAFLVLIATAAIGTAQSPAFEVASIRPADSAHTMSINRSGNRISFSNYSLAMLIEWAYNIRGDRLLGKTKGLESVRYDVEAVTPQQPLPPGQLYLMMRTLLAERFNLAVHNETRELTHYEMIVDKGGAKIHPQPPDGPPGQNPFSMTARGHLSGTKITADMLAKVLTDQSGRFVEDHSGINGVFDFTLDWTPDTAGLSDEPEPSSRNAPSLFTAVREQLGFRLDARKGPVEVVVIDHVENVPTGN
ncbi:MAG TPA: TIGR03435 family protein [Bryobacteraceae bacterium]|nr:TIGR03435 family protein [Bryobacteraceae bacterium]